MIKKEEQPLKISTVEEIRKRKSKILKFPSGIVAKLKKVPIGILLEENLVSKELINQLFKGEKTKEDKSDLASKYKIINIIVEKCFVEPKVVKENPKENEILLDDLDDDDKFFAFNFAVPSEKKTAKKKDL